MWLVSEALKSWGEDMAEAMETDRFNFTRLFMVGVVLIVLLVVWLVACLVVAVCRWLCGRLCGCVWLYVLVVRLCDCVWLVSDTIEALAMANYSHHNHYNYYQHN